MADLDDKFHQAGEFTTTDTNADGHSSGAPGKNYLKWSIGEFRRRKEEREHLVGAASDKEEKERRLLGMVQNLKRPRFGQFAHIVIRINDNIEVSGETALNYIQTRIDRLTAVKANMDAQLSNPIDTKIDIDQRSAQYLQRRMSGEVTVYQRSNGSHYVNRADATKLSSRLTAKIGELEAERDGITTCHHNKHEASVHIGPEASDAIVEGEMERQINNNEVDLEDMSPKQRKQVEAFHAAAHGKEHDLEDHAHQDESPLPLITGHEPQ